ncbi:DUF6869 domain-containing protein [Atopomonas hussainii]|uniref:DUF6869 domain-containing protein n=1 Tax=Atopomonas hussainii TaxID=1429083 RepID=UPI0034A322F0
MNALPELVSAYLIHYRSKDDALAWAYEAVDCAMHDLEHGVSLCLALIEAATNDAEIAYVASGPLEDLLTRVGCAAAEALEAPARRSSKVRLALSCVWLSPKASAYKKWYSLTQQYAYKNQGVGF